MVKGLDDFSKMLKEAQAALSELDGELGVVSFNPSNPASIEDAIQRVNALIDERISQYESNPVIAPLAEEMKDHFRTHIVEKAAEERLKGSNNED